MERSIFLSAAIGALSCLGRVQAASKALHRGTAHVFGTELTVTVLHADEARAQVAIAAALCAAMSVERMVSLADQDSAVCRLNRDGVLAQPDPQLLALLPQACALSDLTGGAFDVTVQPLLHVYADAQRWGALPERHVLDSARAQVGWRRLSFGRECARFLQPGMELTLDGLAPGYAADMALSVLRRHGISDALVDTGAVAATGGGGLQWMAGLPDLHGVSLGTVPLRDRCMATSAGGAAGAGSIVSPATGEVADELVRVTVLAPLGLLADGLAAAFMVMGAKQAHALAARLPGVDVLTVDRRGEMRRSAGFGMMAS
ncbi:FAD:protein FMN transferase [Pseudoduganella ginsengisoli]|uniref:FAD:protein FMN transferase n=1 Tax=Pseudoduganella ginsengisoli TaxID=1462440 RepID=A0A6L6Q9S7_9BURK|nr:FAD:protein FMN transferase [Pseudoduganella ginsengisoli]MTW06186.1 FAD:protein FMN transferase [Pseudoduganella ginsengisoli]